MGALVEILKLLLIDLAIIGAILLALIPLAKFKKATFAVLKRNFVGYFSNPTGYAFLCLFVFLTARAAFRDEFFNANMATLHTLNEWLPLIMLVFIPAITMSIWSEERREGTDELLLTIPAGDTDIVVGKYLAAGAIFSASLVYSQFANFTVLSLQSQGGVDLGLFFSTYLGYWFVGMAMLAISMVASFLTSNLTVGFILGAAFNAPLVFASYAEGSPLARFIAKVGMPANFEDLGRGVLSLPPLLYFAGVAVVGVYLSIVLIGRRHWMGGRDGGSMLLHYTIRAVAVVVIAVSLTVFSTNNLGVLRADLTSNRINSLSPKTYELLESLEIDAKRPVRIYAYISKELPEKFVKTKYDLISMLREIGARKSGIDVFVEDEMETLTEEATNVKNQYGLEPRTVPVVSTGRFTSEQIFLAAVVKCRREQAVIPFFNDPGNIEYELMRSISTVAAASLPKKKADENNGSDEEGDDDVPDRLTVGIIRTDAHVGGISISDSQDFMLARQMGERPQQAVVGLLEKQYNVVKKVDATQPIPSDEYDVLLVVQPSSLPKPQLDNLKDAILAGVPTAIFEDPHPANFGHCPGTDDPRLPSPQAMRGMMGQQPQFPEPKGNVAELFDLLGVKLQRAKRGEVSLPTRANPRETPKIRWRPFTAVVFQNYNPYPKVGSFEDEVVFANRNAIDERTGNEPVFNPKDPVVSGLQEVAFITPGAIQELTPDDIEEIRKKDKETLKNKLEFTPLVRIGYDTGILAEQRFGGIDETAAFIKPIEMRKFDKEETEELDKFENEEEANEFRRRLHAVTAQKGKLRTPEKAYVVAARIRESGGLKGNTKKKEDESKNKDPEDPINVIVVSDADVLSSLLMTFRDRPIMVDINYQFQNVAFVLNIIDALAGDNRFLEIRKRQVNHASLRVIENRIREALDAMSKEREEYEEKLNEQNRLAALELEKEIEKLRTEVEKLEKQTGEPNERARRDAESKLREKLAEYEDNREKKTKELQEQVNKKLEEHQRELNIHRVGIQNLVKNFAQYVPLMPPLLVGFVVFIRRRLREREGVSKQRLRLPS